MPIYSKGPYEYIEDEYIRRPSEGVRHVNTQEWTSWNLHTWDTWYNGYFDINHNCIIAMSLYNIGWHTFDNRTKKAMHYCSIASHNNHCLALRIKDWRHATTRQWWECLYNCQWPSSNTISHCISMMAADTSASSPITSDHTDYHTSAIKMSSNLGQWSKTSHKQNPHTVTLPSVIHWCQFIH
jgi:hypothetical protein